MIQVIALGYRLRNQLPYAVAISTEALATADTLWSQYHEPGAND